MSIDRIRKLAGLQEAEQVPYPSPDDELARENEQRAREDAQNKREARITKLIKEEFHRAGLAIGATEFGDAIYYYEDEERAAEVILDDSEVDFDALLRLKSSYLADHYTIAAGHDAKQGVYFEIRFKVRPNLDSPEIR